jgi:predicted O-methyltransferase YrrM
MFFAILQYIRYFFKAQSNLYVHSPFVYEFCNEVLKAKNEQIPIVNKLNKIYAQDHSIIEREDKGAASKTKIKTIAQLHKIASIPERYGFLMNNMVKKYNVKSVLELGSSLGVSAAYFSNCAEKIITIDADSTIQNIAKKNLLDCKNIEFANKKFDDVLEELIQSNDTFDLVFIDGNHQEEATIKYFEILLLKTHNKSIFIFDDIYWSEGMMRAWEVVKANNKVKISIDLFRMGIIFFDDSIKEKQDFVLMY